MGRQLATQYGVAHHTPQRVGQRYAIVRRYQEAVDAMPDDIARPGITIDADRRYPVRHGLGQNVGKTFGQRGQRKQISLAIPLRDIAGHAGHGHTLRQSQATDRRCQAGTLGALAENDQIPVGEHACQALEGANQGVEIFHGFEATHGKQAFALCMAQLGQTAPRRIIRERPGDGIGNDDNPRRRGTRFDPVRALASQCHHRRQPAVLGAAQAVPEATDRRMWRVAPLRTDCG